MVFKSVNKTLLINLDTTTSSGSCAVNIPFPVKAIIVKQAVIDKTSSYATSLGNAIVVSSLVQNNCIAVLNMQSGVYQPNMKIRYSYVNPVSIQGDFTFTLLGILGSGIFPLANTVHIIALIVEFIAEDSDVLYIN